MTRNLSYRVETVFPIYNESIRKEIVEIMNMQLSDNVKARIIDKHDQNKYQKGREELPIRSQSELYYYYKRRLD